MSYYTSNFTSIIEAAPQQPLTHTSVCIGIWWDIGSLNDVKVRIRHEKLEQ